MGCTPNRVPHTGELWSAPSSDNLRYVAGQGTARAVTRGPGLLIVAFAAMFGAPLLILILGIRDRPSSLLSWLITWGTVIVYGLATCSIAVAARRWPQRRALPWFALAFGLWTCSNLYYAAFVAPNPIPLPSPADIGYFLFSWALGAGIVQGTLQRLPRIPAGALLDAFMIALCAAAVAATLVFSFHDVNTSSFGVLLDSLVYPLEDIVVIGLMVGVGTLLSWRFERPLVILLAGVLSITAGDLITTMRLLEGGPVGGAWANLGWTLGAAILAAGAWAVPPQPRVLVERAFTSYVGLPAAAAAVGLIVLACGALLDLTPVASCFAVATLAAACVRMHLSYAEARALADSHRLALADELTDLPNRRRLLRDLRAACERQDPHLLALYDLDGFKHFNDTHGHSEGDLLLRALANRLAESVRSCGVAYRLGGDEFCVLVPASEEGGRAVHVAGAALAAEGPGWRVTATYGIVEIPREVSTVSDAMRVADRRMYAEKDRRPAAARQQARDVLLSALGEQQPRLHAHTQDVTALAGAVARMLGMAPHEADDVARAAELHDVGKLAIPAAVLDKPGPLDEGEWRLIRQHTIIGERMLAAAPALRAIAPLVRSSHERWDGGGYPDGLAGAEIPLGARIVAVCDSYDAMVTDRPYRNGIPPEEALAEIRRCAGTQFDPAVVEVFACVAEPATLGARVTSEPARP